METEEKKQSRKKWIVATVVYALLFLGIVVIINMEGVDSWFKSVLLLLRPILIGLGLAYLCNPLFRFFERKLLIKMRPQGLRRAISLLLTYLTVILIIALLLLLIVPQLIESIVSFVQNYNGYIASAISQCNNVIKLLNELTNRITGNTGATQYIEYLDADALMQKLSGFFENNGEALMNYLSKIDIKPITEVLGNAVSLITDTLFGIFISLYLLSTKEKRYAQVIKLRLALFSNTTNQRITRICTIADRSFGGFLEGKLLDSLIIGVLTYIAVSIFQIPYALLIATFVGITNIIPVIGPLIGAIPTSLILLLSDPAKVIPFLIIIVVIQQIDGNIIGPKILGSNTGVSSLCVIIAVTTMGSLWGIIGMIVGVPMFATVLELTDEYLTERLQKKGMPSGVENYYANDVIVDPTKNAHPTTDKAVQSLERHALRIQKKQQKGEKPTVKERWLTRVYTLANKYHVITNLTDEGQARFAAVEAAREAELAAGALLQERRNAAQQADDISPDAVE